MKKIFFRLASVALIATGLMTSCSSDYLDVKPGTDINSSQLAEPSVAKALVDGIYEAMNNQYKSLEWNQNTGEAQVNMTCGDACGTDFVSYLFGSSMNVWTYMQQPNSYVVAYPWMYYYNIINLSNYLIQAVPATADDCEGIDPELLFYKAQALTMRAHGYTRLLSYFGQRWQDSDNGEAYCIVLRKEPGTGPTPLVKMNEVLDLIYDDLDQACKLYDLSGKSRSNMWEVDKTVALGIWARAALVKEDWATAAEKAKEARKNYKIMSQQEMFAGFFADTSETMWSMNPTPNTTYYWSWGAHYSCNGAYINNWQIGAGAINIDLYNQLDPNDSRRKFFWTPDKLASVPSRFNRGKLTEKDFWNPNIVDATNILNMAGTDVYNKSNPNGYGMIDALGWWLHDYHMNVFTGDESKIENEDFQYNSYLLAYKAGDPKKSVALGKDANGNNIFATVLTTPFGVQNKFWSMAPYGNMALPWMRASEMALTEAEAEFMLGHEGPAQAALTDVQKNRIDGYKASNTGSALLDEIRLCRRIELWGEGFNFLDLKRWNLPRERRAWVANDPTSGNISSREFAGFDAAAIARRADMRYCNGWRYAIPTSEFRYNDAIDQSLLKTIDY